MPRRRLLLGLLPVAGAALFVQPGHVRAQPGTGSPPLGQPGRAGAAGQPGEDGQPGSNGGRGGDGGRGGNGGGAGGDGGQGGAGGAALPKRQAPPS